MPNKIICFSVHKLNLENQGMSIKKKKLNGECRQMDNIAHHCPLTPVLPIIAHCTGPGNINITRVFANPGSVAFRSKLA